MFFVAVFCLKGERKQKRMAKRMVYQITLKDKKLTLNSRIFVMRVVLNIEYFIKNINEK